MNNIKFIKSFSFTCLMSLFPVAANSANTASHDITIKGQKILQIYLSQDCGSGDSNPKIALNAVMKQRNVTVPLLFVVLKNGPSIELRKIQERDAKASYAKIKRFLNQDGLKALKDKNVVTAANKLNEQRYVAMRMKSFVSGYQERALNALLALKDPKIIKRLRWLKQQAKLPSQLRGIIAMEL